MLDSYRFALVTRRKPPRRRQRSHDPLADRPSDRLQSGRLEPVDRSTILDTAKPAPRRRIDVFVQVAHGAVGHRHVGAGTMEASDAKHGFFLASGRRVDQVLSLAGVLRRSARVDVLTVDVGKVFIEVSGFAGAGPQRANAPAKADVARESSHDAAVTLADQDRLARTIGDVRNLGLAVHVQHALRLFPVVHIRRGIESPAPVVAKAVGARRTVAAGRANVVRLPGYVLSVGGRQRTSRFVLIRHRDVDRSSHVTGALKHGGRHHAVPAFCPENAPS